MQQLLATINRVLGLYQQILQQEEIDADGSPEQMELRLTGAVVQQEGKLRVYNRIYTEVFNLEWVKEELNKLRPYAESLNAWLKSGKQDESRLLQGIALEEALDWRRGKRLSPEDDEFLDASQKVALKTEREANKILKEAERQAKQRTQIGTGFLAAASIISVAFGTEIYRQQGESARLQEQIEREKTTKQQVQQEAIRETVKLAKQYQDIQNRIKEAQTKLQNAENREKEAQKLLTTAQISCCASK